MKIQFTGQIIPNGGIDESKSPQKIEPHRWSSGLNVEPLPDGVRRRAGQVASNSTALQAITISHETGTDSREFADGTSEYISQGFTTVSAISVSRVAVRLKINSGSPTGNVSAAIYANSSGSPGTVVTGADFSDFSEVSSGIDDEFRWFYFTISTAVSLSAATVYHLVIRHTGAASTGTDNYSVQEVTTPSGYSGGTVNISTDAASWTPVAAADLNFRVYAGTEEITAIADYRLSDGATARHIVVAGSDVYKNESGTMTNVSARERLAMTSDADVHPSWAVGNDRLFLTNNTEVSKKFYVLSGTEYWENEGIAAPTASPNLAVSSTGQSLDAGTWYVDYYYWNDDIGQPSDRRYNGAETLSVVVASGEQIDITNLPSTTVRENDRATHIRIEVKAPSTTLFRLAKEITIGTTSTSLTDADFPTTVEAEYEHAVPPVHKVKCVAENRQFILNVDGAPYRLMFSAIVGATSYYESFPANNFRDFGKGDGDYGTALFFVPPRTLIVGFKNSIYAIDPRDPGISDRFIIAKNVGIAGHNAGIVVGNKLFFISNAEKNKGPYVWSGSGEPQYLGGIDNTFKNLNNNRFSLASCANYAPGEDRFQWWTLVSSSGQSDHDRILMFDYAIGSWSVYSKPDTGNILGTAQSSGIDRVFMGGNNGVEYQQDQGSTDAGTSYFGTVTLGAMDFGDESSKKRMRWLDYHVKQQSAGAISVSVEADYDNLPTFTGSLDQFNSNTATWNGFNWNGANWAGSVDHLRRTPLRGAGRVFRPTFSSSSPWHIKGINFGIQGTGRR